MFFGEIGVERFEHFGNCLGMPKKALTKTLVDRVNIDIEAEQLTDFQTELSFKVSKVQCIVQIENLCCLSTFDTVVWMHTNECLNKVLSLKIPIIMLESLS